MYKQSASTAVPALFLELCEKLEIALLDFCRPENIDISWIQNKICKNFSHIFGFWIN